MKCEEFLACCTPACTPGRSNAGVLSLKTADNCCTNLAILQQHQEADRQCGRNSPSMGTVHLYPKYYVLMCQDNMTVNICGIFIRIFRMVFQMYREFHIFQVYTYFLNKPQPIYRFPFSSINYFQYSFGRKTDVA